VEKSLDVASSAVVMFSHHQVLYMMLCHNMSKKGLKAFLKLFYT